ncbi:MAG: type IV pilus modification PilV family protein [Sulfurihydrogenibium sp.]|jgi:prepilin-type N-terminal cleavage/methylation domain-containing protein|uniref:type IV pilus modification PilV family protein n=1 Tax=Sulfurihydrogenibium sp. TaxID=2053621 RepID=UPI000CA9B1DE|nr:MAG: hypothetical protein C0198_00580 [Sulfurihydrogenibium sp.]
MRGFTLIEVLIAIVIVGVSFTVLFELLYRGQKDLSEAKNLFYNFLIVDGKLKQGDLSNLSITTREINVMSLPILERTYEKNGVYIRTYQPK